MQTLSQIAHGRRMFSSRGDKGTKGTDDVNMVDGVYERIKSRLLAQPLVPGQLLQIGVLADELGVSTTPVREALTRLAAERLIIFAPKKGFFAKTPTEEEIRGLYCVNQALLDLALSGWPGISAEKDAARAELVLNGDSVHEQEIQPPTARTADLFLQIAIRSGISELTQLVRNMNDRLHHPRAIECEVIEDVHDELATMCDLYATGRREDMRVTLKSYHERRLGLLSLICKELLFRPFSAAER